MGQNNKKVLNVFCVGKEIPQKFMPVTNTKNFRRKISSFHRKYFGHLQLIIVELSKLSNDDLNLNWIPKFFVQNEIEKILLQKLQSQRNLLQFQMRLGRRTE